MNGDSSPQMPTEDGWQYKPENTAPTGGQTAVPPAQNTMSVPNDPSFAEVEWTASEYIAHEKGPAWYMALLGVTSVLAIIVHFWTRDVFSVIGVVVLGLMAGILGGHKPRTLQYHLGEDGLAISGRLYHYGDFKSFGVLQDEAFSNIVLTPMRRFVPPISVYYPPDQEEKIVTALSRHLPFAPVVLDPLDRLIKNARF